MPKVLDMQMISNAEVLDIIRKTRARHAIEDKLDRKRDSATIERLENFVRSIESHERHLLSDAYPYEKNPSVYTDNTIRSKDTLPTRDEVALKNFSDKIMDRIIKPAISTRISSLKEAGRFRSSMVKSIINQVDGEKAFTETENLIIFNHAPAVIEILQPMIENVDERYTNDELEVILETVKECYRPDEHIGGAATAGNTAAVTEDARDKTTDVLEADDKQIKT